MINYKIIVINIIFVSLFMIFYFFNFITLYVSKIIFQKQIKILIDSVFEDLSESLTTDTKYELVKFIVQYETTKSIDDIIPISDTIDKEYNEKINNLFIFVNAIFYFTLFYLAYVFISIYYYKSENLSNEILSSLYDVFLLFFFETVFICIVTINYMTINPNDIKRTLYNKLYKIITSTRQLGPGTVVG